MMKVKIMNRLPVFVDKRKQRSLKLPAADVLEIERLIRKHKRVGIIVSDIKRVLH